VEHAVPPAGRFPGCWNCRSAVGLRVAGSTEPARNGHLSAEL